MTTKYIVTWRFRERGETVLRKAYTEDITACIELARILDANPDANVLSAREQATDSPVAWNVRTDHRVIHHEPGDRQF